METEDLGVGEKEGSGRASDSPPDVSRAANDEEVRVTDRRRFGSSGELVAHAESDPVEDLRIEGLSESSQEIQALQAKLNEAERQVQEYADRFKKAQVHLRLENDELRNRLQKNFEQKLQTARGDLVLNLLEVFDNLRRAVASAQKSEGRKSDFEALLEGVRATADLFQTKLGALGLEVVPTTGVEFDPQVHDAVEMVAVAPEEDHLVVAELQPGYKFGERLLRPARVRVGRSSD
jgi:molecular chaperone GrpE